MRRIFCICDDEGDLSELEILSFIEISQYHPFTPRAVCVDKFGNITTPSIQQIKVLPCED